MVNKVRSVVFGALALAVTGCDVPLDGHVWELSYMDMGAIPAQA